jgi:hypothetical protein
MKSKRILSKKTKYIKGGTKKDKKEPKEPKEPKEKLVKTVKKRPKLIIVEEIEKIPSLLQTPSTNVYGVPSLTGAFGYGSLQTHFAVCKAQKIAPK